MLATGGQVLAISTDDQATSQRFRAKIKADFPLIPDPSGRIVTQYGVKLPLLTVAKRITFVIGRDGIIERMDAGLKAVNPDEAIQACPID